MKFIFETFLLLFMFVLLSGCAQSPISPILECNRKGDSWIQERCQTKKMLKEGLEESKKTLMKQAEAGNTDAMNNLGQIYFNGMYGTEQNYDKAFEYYSKSCTIDTSGCKQSEFMLESGYVSKTNLAKANELVIKACRDGIAESCVNAGNLYQDGQRVKFDLTKAADFYGKACDLGDTRGCVMYKNIKSPQPVQQAVNNSPNSDYQQEQLNIQRQQLKLQQEQNLQNQLNSMQQENQFQSQQNAQYLRNLGY